MYISTVVGMLQFMYYLSSILSRYVSFGKAQSTFFSHSSNCQNTRLKTSDVQSSHIV